MKYVVILGDGMADLPLSELEGRTPLTVAYKPNMNFIASKGINGRVNCVPEGMVPESDTANLAIMGYDPRIYSKGRSPLEAASMGLSMDENDTAIRANLVALGGKGNYEELTMLDHSSDEIPTEQARVLIEAIDDKFGNDYRHFYTGVSYRHCVIWKNCPEFDDFSRPHDIIGKVIGDYLPKKESSRPMLELMKASYDFLNDHPLNIEREKNGLKRANSLWLWSPGTKPFLPDFKEKTGLNGSVVCAVDLIKGIGVCAGMSVPFVEGATGALNTNYKGKCDTAIEELKKGSDFVYIHIEAPDECGHQGDYRSKIKSIENIDKFIVGPIMEYLNSTGERYRILVSPDHPTPVYARTHIRDAVPFAIYDSYDERESNIDVYDEKSGFEGSLYLDRGEDLIDLFTGEKL